MANEITIGDAIESLLPDANYGVGDGNVISWKDYNVDSQPTDSAIATEQTRLQAMYDAQAYARLRKTAYALLNQFELIGDDATNGTTTHKDAIAAIKAAHPKP